MNFHFSVTYNRAKEKSDRGMEAESHFRQFAAFVTQKVYMLLNRRGIPTLLKRTQNHKEAFISPQE